MSDVGAAMRAAGVVTIYLVHGTFIGPDALGVLTDLSRFAPSLAESLRRWNKQVLDAVARETGNFTRKYAELLEQGLNRGSDSPISVRLCHWSSENHHLGRADGAVRLIHDLFTQRKLQPEKYSNGRRVLLWGHSHGGNVFALMTNLLGSELDARREFFERTRSYYRGPVFRRVDLPQWVEVRDLVCENMRPFEELAFDFVTFGTPVRYGWDTDGYSKLLHFVNHRRATGLPGHQAPFPPTADDLLHACGDFVQQIGVAGTNLAPPFWAWRSWLADVRLGKMLQKNCRSADLYSRWCLGVRAHADGENLFVDYGPGSANIAQHLFGHAVYTRCEWQLFHAEEVARRFYDLVPAAEKCNAP